MNPIQRSWAYVSRKRLRSFILFLILLVLLAGISACLTLMKSNKTVETNLYKSLNTSFSIKKIENGQTFKLSDLASVSKIKGLENVSPELETVAKLKDKEAVSGEQSVERDDLSAADKNLDDVMKELNGISGINWKSYTLVKSSSNYPALEQSISGMYKMANLLFWGSLSFSVLLLALLLSLWINARRKEVGILLSIGLKQASILGQFITESILIAIPALVSAYFLANYTARAIGNTVLANVTSGVAKQASKAVQASNLGGGAEVDGFSKTLSSLDISIQTSDFIIVFVLALVLVVAVMALASSNLLRKQPKELLLDGE
ncbi:ABC transporter permease [Streptococcus pneumoniae]|nr:ABC transporter permease [Streptococcus pneumoniae]